MTYKRPEQTITFTDLRKPRQYLITGTDAYGKSITEVVTDNGGPIISEHSYRTVLIRDYKPPETMPVGKYAWKLMNEYWKKLDKKIK